MQGSPSEPETPRRAPSTSSSGSDDDDDYVDDYKKAKQNQRTVSSSLVIVLCESNTHGMISLTRPQTVVRRKQRHPVLQVHLLQYLLVRLPGAVGNQVLVCSSRGEVRPSSKERRASASHPTSSLMMMMMTLQHRSVLGPPSPAPRVLLRIFLRKSLPPRTIRPESIAWES